jgi:hypothetical protein
MPHQGQRVVLAIGLRADGDVERTVFTECDSCRFHRLIVGLDHPRNNETAIGFQVIGKSEPAQLATGEAFGPARPKTGAVSRLKASALIIEKSTAIDGKAAHGGDGVGLLLRQVRARRSARSIPIWAAARSMSRSST